MGLRSFSFSEQYSVWPSPFVSSSSSIYHRQNPRLIRDKGPCKHRKTRMTGKRIHGSIAESVTPRTLFLQAQWLLVASKARLTDMRRTLKGSHATVNRMKLARLPWLLERRLPAPFHAVSISKAGRRRDDDGGFSAHHGLRSV